MKTFVRAMLPVALLVVTTQAAQAQRFGPQLSWGDDSDLGLGGRLEFNLGGLFQASGTLERSFGIASFDYFFRDCDTPIVEVDCTYWEFGLNGAIPLVAGNVDPYVGGGLHLARFKSETDVINARVDDTDLGLNVLGGLRFMLGTLSTFTEARLELAGGKQLVLTFGALFGSR